MTTMIAPRRHRSSAVGPSLRCNQLHAVVERRHFWSIMALFMVLLASTIINGGGVGAQAVPQQPCPDGEFVSTNSVSGASTCAPCPAGTFSTRGDNCKPCDQGSYSAKDGSSSCSICPAGFYCPGPGIATPTPCYPGMVSSQEGLINGEQCTRCPSGTYAPDALKCEDCLPGTYTDSIGNAACWKCPFGTWSDVRRATSSSTCQKCPAGTQSLVLGASSASTCTPCPAGTYSPPELIGLGQACLKCPAGTRASGVTGAISADVACTTSPCAPGNVLKDGVSCEPCPAGQACPGTPNTTPVDCEPGTFAPAGSTSCSKCPANTYADTKKAATCNACPAKGLGPEGSSSVDNCRLNDQKCAVRIQWDKYMKHPGGELYLHLSEVQLYHSTYAPEAEIPRGELTATLSSEWYTKDAPARNCIDGRTDTICHGGAGDELPTLEIAYPCKYKLSKVIAINRRDFCCKARITNYKLLWRKDGSQPVAPSPLPFANVQDKYTFTGFLSDSDICKPGSFWKSDGTTFSCQPCPAGQYCPQAQTTTPLDCGPGTFSSAGSAACSKCPSNTYSNAAKATSAAQCTACPGAGAASVKDAPEGGTSFDNCRLTSEKCAVRIQWKQGIAWPGVKAGDNAHLNLREVELFQKLTSGTQQQIPPNELTAALSSVWDNDPKRSASACIDGSETQDSVCHSGQFDRRPVLEVAFPCKYTLSSIKVFNRLGCCGDRIVNYEVLLRKNGIQPVQPYRFSFDGDKADYTFSL